MRRLADDKHTDTRGNRHQRHDVRDAQAEGDTLVRSDELEKQLASGGLAAGKSITRRADAGPEKGFWFPRAPGKYVIKAVADSTRQAAGSNERNNSLSETIEVEATTPVAVASDTSASTPVDTSVIIDVLANDTAPAGYALVVAAVQSPTEHGGTAVITPDGKLVTYTPPAGFSGDDSFTYENGIVPA